MKFEAVMMTTYVESDEYIALQHLMEGNQLIQKIEQSQQYSEKMLRNIMILYLDAFWVFPELRHRISNTIHQIGRELEEQFQCKCHYSSENKAYYTNCPAHLLHYDFGFSFRGTEKYKCSICGKSIIECEHIADEFYDNITCNKVDGYCNICGREICNHIIDKQYNQVQAVKIVYDINLVTFDMVEDPQMKFARVSRVYFTEDDIVNNLSQDEKQEFRFGSSELFCHHCSQCQGYIPNLLGRLKGRST